jgi:archaellum biogenesis ATPase FlaH
MEEDITMSERRILAALVHDRSVYDSIEPVMDIEDDFSDQGKIIASAIKEYYENDENADCVDRGFLIDQVRSEMPKHFELFEGIINSLEEVSIPNALSEFRKLKQESAAQHLAEALLSKDPTRISSYMEKYTHYRDMSDSDAAGSVFIDHDLDEILSTFSRDNLIKVYPNSLNEKLGGGIVRGTQMAIYAPTEVGKSLLSINIASGFLHQGLKVMYCGNEDPAYSMIARFYSRLTGMDRDELALNRVEARKRALANGFQNLIFFEMSPGSIFDIKRMLDRYEPDVIIVDQMANMETKANFTKVEKNEYLAIKLRSLAKKYNLVSIIVHQASDSAYGKLSIEKNDMYYSNVGVQGQMDVMIGIGMDDVFDQQDKRMLCLTKNKISSNHSHIPVNFSAALSKVTDITGGE